MQRVLSGERARCIESSEEFVTKKLCFSFVIVCAFFSLLGGFLLGRYAMEKASATKKPFTEQKHQTEMLDQLSTSITKITALTNELSLRSPSTLSALNYSEFYAKLMCYSDNKVIPDVNSPENVNLGTNEIITTDLNFLQQCYDNVSIFLESVLVPD